MRDTNDAERGSSRNAPWLARSAPEGATERKRTRASTKRHDREATERDNRGWPAGRPIGREERKVCVYVYARKAMIRVYHSHDVYRATMRGVAREELGG